MARAASRLRVESAELLERAAGEGERERGDGGEDIALFRLITCSF